MPIIQSIDRALEILDLFNESQPELKMTEISSKMGLNKSTVHSILKTLQKHNYIEQNQENGKYKLGIKLFERGNFVISQLDIRAVSRRHLEGLSKLTGYTCHLVILSGKEGVYIDKVEGPSATILYSRIGRRIPVHCSAVGKVLIAFEESSNINDILRNYNYSKSTPNTLTNETDFIKELEVVQRQGFAVDYEENEQGVICLAVPIFGHNTLPIAAISLSMPAPRYEKENVDELIKELKAVGYTLSHEMGYIGKL